MTPLSDTTRGRWSRLFSEYGMLLVLILLCGGMSVLTITETFPNGRSAGAAFAAHVVENYDQDQQVVVVTGKSEADIEFSVGVSINLQAADITVVDTINGTPRDARRTLITRRDHGEHVDLIVCNNASAGWEVWKYVNEDFQPQGGVQVIEPQSYYWPSFLKTSNLLNVINNATVIAMIGIGMTMVIITGGIDLSVGSLVALAAVVSTLMIRDLAGGMTASGPEMVLCCVAAIVLCGLLGGFSGTIVLTFNTRPYVVPPFIMTLSMMMIARGLAYMISGNETIPAAELPDEFNGLGGGSLLGPIPNPVVLMLVLFAVAHIMMTHTTLGRYIYAVGGNPEAARLSGVPVKRVLLLVYTGCGLLSGLGGVVLASRLSSGSAQYGLMYELHIIAAVVVGGTSLSGGEGSVFGTLIGALIIAVVQSGLNQRGISGREQDLVLGLIILAAVLLDMLNKRGWRISRSQA
ncbi:MAG: ABC transporter permease [Planctomycetaceae bacterium]